jgi:hypothetical protein
MLSLRKDMARMERKYFTIAMSLIVAFTLFTIFAPVDVAAQKKKIKQQATKQPEAPGITETLKPNQLWISSIPAGLEFKITRDSSMKKDTGSTRVIKGKTPMVVDLEPGMYHAQVSSTQKQIGEAAATHWNIVCDDKMAGVEMKILADNTIGFLPVFEYTFEKKADTSMSLIALAQPVVYQKEKLDFMLDNIDSLIAKGVAFRFDETAVKKVLIEQGTPESVVLRALPLLKRAGKIALPKEGDFYSIEITGVNKWETHKVLAIPYMHKK